MEPEAGGTVYYQLLPDDRARRSATVVTWGDVQVRLRLAADAPAGAAADRHILLLEENGEAEHYGRITGRDGDILTLNRMMTGKRGYFRVSDVIPVVCRRVDAATPTRGTVVAAGYGTAAADQPDETISPRLWSLLTDINAKLGMILEHLKLEDTGLIRAERVPVNISASGIRLALKEPAAAGDLMEIKMLLPGSPAAAVVAYGNVVRAVERERGSFETAIRFADLDHDVQDAIIQYTLNRQREIIWKLKQ